MSHRRPAGYREAIRWIALNDDCEWLKDPEGEEIASVTACMVMDLFGREDKEVIRDLRRELDQSKRDG